MAANKIFADQNGIIVIEVVGDQNAASVELMGREASVLLTKMRAAGKPGLILDDLLQIGRVDEGGRKLVVDFGKRLDYDRLAMVGKGGIMRLGANLLLLAIGRSEKIKYFDDHQKAVDWLAAGVAAE